MADQWRCSQCIAYPKYGQYEVPFGSPGNTMLAARCELFNVEVYGLSSKPCFSPRDSIWPDRPKHLKGASRATGLPRV